MLATLLLSASFGCVLGLWITVSFLVSEHRRRRERQSMEAQQRRRPGCLGQTGVEWVSVPCTVISSSGDPVYGTVVVIAACDRTGPCTIILERVGCNVTPTVECT